MVLSTVWMNETGKTRGHGLDRIAENVSSPLLDSLRYHYLADRRRLRARIDFFRSITLVLGSD